MQKWKTLSREVVFERSKFLRVEDHIVELPDGRVIQQWPWVITPDYINVIALTEDNKFLCFRQTKYAIDGTTLAPVGGYLEVGEEPLSAAKRELLEETGYEAQEWIDLGHYRVDANRGAGTAYLFLALKAKLIVRPNADDLEEQHLLHLSRAEIENALAIGEFKSLSWTTTVALALRHLAL